MTDRPALPAGMRPQVEVLPVSPETCTVLGYRVKASDAVWRGLDFNNAEVRDKSNALVFLLGYNDAPYDLHLNVPFRHPDDPPEDYEGVKYRVRPIPRPGGKWHDRMIDIVAIEPAPDRTPPWQIVVRYSSDMA